jgi:hypothetical protein
MSYEERGTWVYLLVSLGVYAAYVIVVLSRAADPITDTVYQAPLLWSIGAAILAAIVLRMVVEIGAGVARGVGDDVAKEIQSRTGAKAERRAADPFRADARDREIDQLGNQRTWIVAAAGALAAMLMALAEWPFFWIANVIYLGFVLQAVSSAIVKLVLYRRGF